MKIISSTNSTSIIGVMLISALPPVVIAILGPCSIGHFGTR